MDETKKIYTSGGLALTVPAVNGYITSFKKEYVRKTSETSYLDERINELKELQKTAFESEVSFFSMLGYKNKSPKQNIEELQLHIDTVVNSEMNDLLDINFYKTFMGDPNIRNAIKDKSESTIRQTLTDHSDDLLQGLNLDVLTANEIVTQLSQSAQLNGKTFMVYKNVKAPRGLAKFLKKTVDPITGIKWQFDFNITDSNGKKLSFDTEIGKKLMSLISQNVTQQFNGKIERFRDYVNQIIEQHLRTSDFKQLARQEFRNLSGYALNFNENSLKGYVAEITTNILLNYLTHGQGTAVATGAIKESLSKKGKSGASIMIDTILNGYNFQIKSWNLEGGKYYTREKVNAGNFIVDRLELGYYDALLNLFGTYQFNQEYNDSYKPTQKQLNILMNPSGIMQNIFAAHLDKILRQNRTFSSAFSSLSAYTQYYNTFFMINKKLIPSSEILRYIIEELDKLKNNIDKEQDGLISFQLTNISNNKEATTLKKIRKQYVKRRGDEKKLRHYPETIFDMAELVTIAYDLSLDIGAILKNVYNKVK